MGPYCTEVAGVVCEACPLRLVQESAWQTAVQPETLPYYTAEAIGRALGGLTGPGGTIEFYQQHVADGVLSERKAKLEAVDTVLGTLSQDILLPNSVVYGRDDRTPTERTALRTIAKRLGECVAHKWEGTCVAAEEVSLGPVLPDKEWGARVLVLLAQHGPEADVKEMLERLLRALEPRLGEDYTAQVLERIDLMQLPQARTMLKRMAGMLGRGEFGAVTQEDAG